jgi:hypothetical protein
MKSTSSKTAAGTLVVSQYNPRAIFRKRLTVASIWLVSLVALYIFCKTTMTPGFMQTQTQLKQTQVQVVALEGSIEELRTRLAVAERGLQVSDEAKAALQRDLEARTDEMNAMRADLSFFQKFTGGGNVDALGVQEVLIQSTPEPRVFNFRFALSQNLKRGTMARGRINFTVSGTLNGKIKRLKYSELVGEGNSDKLTYEFKYFQLFDGTIFLPEGFTPSAVNVRMQNDSGESAEKETAWSKALNAAPSGNTANPASR